MNDDIGEPTNHFLASLARYAWLVGAITVAVCVATLAYSRSQPARYGASARVLLALQQPDPQIQGGQTYLPTSDQAQRFVATQVLLAQSPALAARFLAERPRYRTTQEKLLKHISVSASGDSDILVFAAYADDRSEAIALANAYAQEYATYRRGLDANAYEGALKGVRARIVQARKAVAASSGDTAGVSQSVLTSLLVQQQDLLTAAALQSEGARLQSAALTAKQVAPSPKRDAALGAIVGLLLGIALVLAIDALDTRVRDSREAQDLLGVPVLGAARRPRRRNVIASRESPEADTYRKLRLALELPPPSGPARVVMVSSGGDRTVASAIAPNLAVAVARSGSSVILVDLDLRRSPLTGMFDIDPGPGVAGVLDGSAGLARALRSVLLAGQADPLPAGASIRLGGTLKVLTTGPSPSAPGDVVASSRIAVVFAALRAAADVIVVVAPPMLESADAIAISRSADVVLVGVACPSSRRDRLAQLRGVLGDLRAAEVGAVLVWTGRGSGRRWYRRSRRQGVRHAGR